MLVSGVKQVTVALHKWVVLPDDNKSFIETAAEHFYWQYFGI